MGSLVNKTYMATPLKSPGLPTEPLRLLHLLQLCEEAFISGGSGTNKQPLKLDQLEEAGGCVM